MQRVTKYRAWDISEQCWINISKMVFGEEGELWYLQSYDENENEIDLPYFENETNWILMQCAGLKDKNGVDVYEGDIVTYRSVYKWNDKIKKGVVKFSNGMFNPGNVIGWGKNGTCEVIGNIYENPELLEVK